MNALEVSGLKKSYGDFSLDVSFALEQGKITGLSAETARERLRP